MAVLKTNTVVVPHKAGGKGEVQIEHLLTEKELDGKCKMYARITIKPGCSIGLHEHHGNTETMHILQGEALYNDNGTEIKLHAGATTFCPDGEKHSIENCAVSGDLVFMGLVIIK